MDYLFAISTDLICIRLGYEVQIMCHFCSDLCKLKIGKSRWINDCSSHLTLTDSLTEY